jgi:hypothetical protein
LIFKAQQTVFTSKLLITGHNPVFYHRLMELYEIPKFPLFNGEKIFPERFRGDNVATQQWLFEKHYANSNFNGGIPFFDRFFHGTGFAQYQFYRGEDKPATWINPEAFIWWYRERRHWNNYGIRKENSPYILFLREWIFARAADESGFNMMASDTNPWLDQYLEFAPMAVIDL